MLSEAVLKAETDRATLDVLPQVLSHSLDHVSIDICTSADELARNLRKLTYDTVAVSPVLIQDYRIVKSKKPFQLLAPLPVTRPFKRSDWRCGKADYSACSPIKIGPCRDSRNIWRHFPMLRP